MTRYISTLLTALSITAIIFTFACSSGSDKDIDHLVVGQEYQIEYGSQEGVIKTASGLQYKILNSGEDGAATPTKEDIVNIQVYGTLVDGTVFTGSESTSSKIFPVNGLFEGWTEALLLMKTGDTFEFVIPSDLAYGSNSASEGEIPANSTLILTIELSETGQSFLDKNATKEGVTVTDSGLQYKILTSGAEGGASPTAQDRVSVHYHGTHINGTVFDSSVNRGTPSSFAVSGVIEGWTEALQLMKVGDKFELTIPHSLAYGSRGQGSIPPYSVLIFEVELLKINP